VTAITQTSKMVNGSRLYRALESVSIASALSTALPFTHAISADSLNSHLPTARKEWCSARVDSLPRRLPVNWNTLR